MDKLLKDALAVETTLKKKIKEQQELISRLRRSLAEQIQAEFEARKYADELKHAMKKIPKLGEIEKVLQEDSSKGPPQWIDPPVGDYEAVLENMRPDPEIEWFTTVDEVIENSSKEELEEALKNVQKLLSNVDACVCFDEDGNALNECDECPR